MSQVITRAQWLTVLSYCGVSFTTAVRWAPIFEARVQPDSFSLGARELDDFVGQILHETARLETLEEDLNYSAKRLVEVWPMRFPNTAAAAPYVYNPEALANKVYGGRLGNTQPGDGFRFFGRGIPQVTGRANYQLVQDLTGIPVVTYPERLADPDTAMQCGIHWWEKRIPDSAIDTIERVSRAVNGADVGLADRTMLTGRAEVSLKSIGLVVA